MLAFAILNLAGSTEAKHRSPKRRHRPRPSQRNQHRICRRGASTPSCPTTCADGAGWLFARYVTSSPKLLVTLWPCISRHPRLHLWIISEVVRSQPQRACSFPRPQTSAIASLSCNQASQNQAPSSGPQTQLCGTIWKPATLWIRPVVCKSNSNNDSIQSRPFSNHNESRSSPTTMQQRLPSKIFVRAHYSFLACVMR